MRRPSHSAWLVRWGLHLTEALARRRKIIDLMPSMFMPRRRLIYDRRTGRLRRFHMRNDNSDYRAYDQNIARTALDLSRFPQNARLQQCYQAMVADGKTPIVIDCGANIGTSTYWLATEFPLARILAVEPDAENARYAELNTSVCGNVRVIQGAISAADGKVDLDQAERGADSYRTVVSENGTIPAYSIAGLLRQEDATGEQLLLVKIDIEGFEENLFAQNTDWVADASVIIVEPHDWMLPGRAASRHLLRAISSGDRDFLVDGEHVLSFQNA